MMYFVWITALAALMQIASSAYRRFDVDYIEGELIPRRFIVWGTCHPLSKRPEHTFRYVSLVLPVRKWEFDNCRREWCWHQLAINKFAGRWSVYWIPA